MSATKPTKKAETLGITEAPKPTKIAITQKQMDALSIILPQITELQNRLQPLLTLRDAMLEAVAQTGNVTIEELTTRYQFNGKEFFLPKAK